MNPSRLLLLASLLLIPACATVPTPCDRVDAIMQAMRAGVPRGAPAPTLDTIPISEVTDCLGSRFGSTFQDRQYGQVMDYIISRGGKALVNEMAAAFERDSTRQSLGRMIVVIMMNSFRSVMSDTFPLDIRVVDGLVREIRDTAFVADNPVSPRYDSYDRLAAYALYFLFENDTSVTSFIDRRNWLPDNAAATRHAIEQWWTSTRHRVRWIDRGFVIGP
jgi:hypothetical protein